MIKVLVPLMPTAAQVLPYLLEMDASRVYVKGGPLVRRLEQQLTDLVGAPCTAVANGTVSLELALRALGLPPGAGVLVPAVTFVASGQAIVNAGLQPVICDVGRDAWQLEPDAAQHIVMHAPGIHAVMPVATFGLAVPFEPWDAFNRRTRIPVLIDAAGAIYDQVVGQNAEILVSFSLNATKALGAGEGGAVASFNRAALERIASLANFGPGGTNARMSEYHAAVALASLQQTSPAWRAMLHGRYAERLHDSIQIIGGGQSRRTLYPVLLPEHINADEVGQEMARAGIETKAWYRPFLDERDEFLGCPKYGPMPNTDQLRRRLIGLPFHAFMTADDLELVCDTINGILA